MYIELVTSVGGFDEVFPFAEFLSKNDLYSGSLLVSAINLPLDVVAFELGGFVAESRRLIKCTMYYRPSLVPS